MQKCWAPITFFSLFFFDSVSPFLSLRGWNVFPLALFSGRLPWFWDVGLKPKLPVEPYHPLSHCTLPQDACSALPLSHFLSCTLLSVPVPLSQLDTAMSFLSCVNSMHSFPLILLLAYVSSVFHLTSCCLKCKQCNVQIRVNIYRSFRSLDYLWHLSLS